jgi:hypothetical protein
MTGLITLSFMMRSTSPIGWMPLLLIKIIYEGSFKPFLISGILIALPIMGLCTVIDSYYYGQLTITSLTFL